MINLIQKPKNSIYATKRQVIIYLLLQRVWRILVMSPKNIPDPPREAEVGKGVILDAR